MMTASALLCLYLIFGIILVWLSEKKTNMQDFLIQYLSEYPEIQDYLDVMDDEERAKFLRIACVVTRVFLVVLWLPSMLHSLFRRTPSNG